MGQFAQRVVVPDGPAVPALQPGNAGVDIVLGVGVVVPPELPRPQRPLQVGQRITVRLKGAEQERKFKASGAKSVFMPQQGGCQQFVTAFLQDAPPMVSLSELRTYFSIARSGEKARGNGKKQC